LPPDPQILFLTMRIDRKEINNDLIEKGERQEAAF